MIGFLFSVLLIAASDESALSPDSAKDIHVMMSALHENGEFNGSILVAVKGNVVYSHGFGMANFKTGTKFTEKTPSCLASVTKQFTALGVMMLAEQHKLKYDDPVSKYLHQLPDCYEQVTIRHMLTHTSGIYDYSDLGSGSPDNAIARKTSLRFPPGQKYEYSNSNYVLLSLIIEKVSGISFTDFLQQRIFDPLRMRDTFVHPSQKSQRMAVGYNQFGKEDDISPGAQFGDGGIYSTVQDLLKWDQALYKENLVRQSTLAEAFVPAEVKEGKNTYGFGWNVSDGEQGKYVWHTGNTAGFRAYIRRMPGPEITVIILTNTGHSRRIEIADAIVNILSSHPYSLPKMSAAKKMYTTLTKHGLQRALHFYDSLKQTTDGGGYDFAESEFNMMGYELLGEKRLPEAIEIFRLNTVAFPLSSNTFDSLGEAYLKNGDKDLARTSYKKALEIDPSNQHASDMLKKLK